MRQVLLVWLFVASFGAFGLPIDSRAAQGIQTSDPLDLAALLLRPADLAAAGLDGYGTGVSATGGGDTIGRFDERYRGGAVTAPLLETADVERGSSLYLVRNDDLDLPSPDRVLSTIARFSTAEDASDAYGALVADRGTIAVDPGTSVDVDDGKATAFLVTGSDPLGADTYRQASVVAVVGNLVVEVAVELTSDRPLTIDLASDLFGTEVERIAGAAPDSAGLGNHSLVVTGSAVDPELSRYVYLDGESVPASGQSADAMVGQAATFAAFDAEDVFQSAYRSTDGTLAIGSFVSRHASDAAARSYFRAIPDLLASDDAYRDVRVGNAIVPVGDSATSVTYALDGDASVMVTELVFRAGSVVAELIVDAPATVSTADLTTLGRALAACLDRLDCPSIAIPKDVDPGGAG